MGNTKLAMRRADAAPGVSPPSRISILRTPGAPEIVFEGFTVGFTVRVTNAVKGQTFHLWYANSMTEDDFENSLIADVMAALPEGVTAARVSPTRLMISLKDGS